MKLVSFVHDGKSSWGALRSAGIVDLGARTAHRSLLDFLRADKLDKFDELGDQAAGLAPDYSLDEIIHAKPIEFPEKIFCIGVNYVNRNEEYRDGSDLPRYPSVFMRAPGSLVAHRQPIVRPRESEQLDYEGEIAIIIGTGGRRIPESRATQHIAGLSIVNEGTVRDWLRHGKFNVTQGKNFERSGAFGPWMVTADEFELFDGLRVRTRVNGELRQDDTTANLLFSFRYLINYLSTFSALKPGDVICTGTPSGAGARLDPPRYLKAGDRVEVEVDGIGTLSSEVIDDDA